MNTFRSRFTSFTNKTSVQLKSLKVCQLNT